MAESEPDIHVICLFDNLRCEITLQYEIQFLSRTTFSICNTWPTYGKIYETSMPANGITKTVWTTTMFVTGYLLNVKIEL